MSTLAEVVVLDPETSATEATQVARAVGGSLSGAVTRGDGWAALVATTRPSGGWEGVEKLPWVRYIAPVSDPYRLASRQVFGNDVQVKVSRDVAIGGAAPVALVVGSRWAMASEARLRVLAPLLREAGCTVFRAGRLAAGGQDGAPGVSLPFLRVVREIADEHGFAVSAEIVHRGQISAAERYADILEVGSHNMQDFGLLRDLGDIAHPVLLNRGHGATVEELLLAAEYILCHGNGRVMLCESGIRTFDSTRRPRFEINAVPLIKQSTHLPLLADPSVSTAHARVLPGVAKAAVAAGADGVALEVGTEAGQDVDRTAIDIVTLRRLLAELKPVARAVGRSVHKSTADGHAPTDVRGLLETTDRTLGLVIESIIGVHPQLEVVSQWREQPPIGEWLGRSLSRDSELLARCTSYRMGSVRLSRNLAYVDLRRIDKTIAVLLESKQLNLGQLFLDPRIEKRSFTFGTHDDAGEIDDVLEASFPGEIRELRPYVWRRYEGVIDGEVVFVVMEALPADTWDRLLQRETTLVAREGPTP